LQRSIETVLNLALVGCGGMGRRHIRGFQKLRSIGRNDFRLAAVCDPFEENGRLAADTAAELLSFRPTLHASLDALLAGDDQIDALILTTAPDTHAEIGAAALDAGLDVLVEKPIALTVRQGLLLVEAAQRSGRVLAVAENYRRDPMNRLAKAVIDAGLIGRPFLAVQMSSGSGGSVIITPWRHLRRTGGIIIDMGIHYADILEYLLGPIDQLVGLNATVDHQRADAAGTLHDADAEDLSVGVARFCSGAIANWVVNLAARGESSFARTVYGTSGTLAIPHDRSGDPLRLTIREEGQEIELSESDILSRLPGFSLDDVTAALFGGDRLGSYRLEFADIDANLLAIEQADFFDAIAERRAPEVDGPFGLRSLAITYGFLESERLGRFVEVERLIAGFDSPCQDDIMAGAVN